MVTSLNEATGSNIGEMRTMNGTAFKLGTFAKSNGASFAAIVLGDDAIELGQAYEAYRAAGRRGALSATNSINQERNIDLFIHCS